MVQCDWRWVDASRWWLTRLVGSDWQHHYSAHVAVQKGPGVILISNWWLLVETCFVEVPCLCATRCLAAGRHSEIARFVDWNNSHKYKLVQKKMIVMIGVGILIAIFLGTIVDCFIVVYAYPRTRLQLCWADWHIRYYEWIRWMVIMNSIDDLCLFFNEHFSP